jgi:hypothetical protein
MNKTFCLPFILESTVKLPVIEKKYRKMSHVFLFYPFVVFSSEQFSSKNGDQFDKFLFLISIQLVFVKTNEFS